jgi:cell division protein FtsN
MPRDYKHIKRRGGGAGLPGWAGVLVGLAIGLSVALGVYLYDRRPSAKHAEPEAPLARDEGTANDKPVPASQEPETETEFEFYDMLPKFEVVIPEKGGEAAVPNAEVRKPGAYVLQAGSFRNFADADRMRALIALQGVESKIQKVTVDKDTWHRVRIGPIKNLEALEETRSKLRSAQIDALVIRVGE